MRLSTQSWHTVSSLFKHKNAWLERRHVLAREAVFLPDGAMWRIRRHTVSTSSHEPIYGQFRKLCFLHWYAVMLAQEISLRLQTWSQPVLHLHSETCCKWQLFHYYATDQSDLRIEKAASFTWTGCLSDISNAKQSFDNFATEKLTMWGFKSLCTHQKPVHCSTQIDKLTVM